MRTIEGAQPDRHLDPPVTAVRPPDLLGDLRRLETFYARVEAALVHTAPPADYAGTWVDYGHGIEAEPYSWLRVLVAEALEDCR